MRFSTGSSVLALGLTLIASAASAQQPVTSAPPKQDTATPTAPDAPAAPQTAPAPSEQAGGGEIVVTGSSIRGIASAGSPTIGVGLQELRQTGVATATDALRLLPQVINLGADESRSSFNGGAQDGAANSTAVNGVNLRGLGPESTLLLVNGRRVAQSGVIKALYDLNIIPTNAISRLEVVTDGASAIYGADAVAGVVNVITKKRTNEIESMARYGFGDDISQKVFGQTLGLGWGSGSFFGSYEHNERTNLAAADRNYTSQDRRNRGGSDARSTLASPGNILIGGVRYPLPAGNGTGLNRASIVAGTPNVYDEGLDTDLLPSQNRESFFGNIYQNVTPGLQLWVEGFYTTRNFRIDQPAASATLTVPRSNAFFLAPAGLNPASEQVEYRFAKENADPASYGHERNYQIASGFDLDLPHTFRLSGYAQYSRDDGFQSRNSIVNNAALAAALASSNPATAFNPFGDGSFNLTNNPSLVDTIIANRDTSGHFTNWDYSLKLDGPLFALPGGDVRVAAGAEYHRNRFEQKLEATNVLASGAPTFKFVDNKRQFYSFFSEVFVPIFGSSNAIPGLQRLELSGAVRYDHYSDFGSTTNPKIGVIYSPLSGVVLRGTYGTSFRAPSLVDTSNQLNNIFIQNLTDPSSPTGVTRGVFINGGNPDLTPEEADTWSFGLDLKPRFVPGLTITASYYKVKYTNRIDVVPGTALTSPVYSAYYRRRPTDAAGATAFNALIASYLASPDLQSPAEPVANLGAFVDGRRQNLGTLKQSGFDVSIGYAFDTGFGNLRLGADISDILKIERQTVAGTPFVDVLDTFGNPVDFRGRGTAIFSSGAFSLASFVNYIDSYTNTAITPNVKAKSYVTADFNLGYDFDRSGSAPAWMKGTRLSVSIQNAFDRNPPIVLNGTLSYDTQNINPTGRFVALELTKKW